MVVLSSLLLTESIENNPTGVESILVITCLGLLIGPIHPVKKQDGL